MHRVAIVGPGGAGKSTFARSLGARARLPVVHLDEHFWKPGWVETRKDEWRERQRELFSAERWIADGNYGGTFDVRFARADTVIVIARSRLACVVGALRRSILHRGAAAQAPGCPERFDLAFYRWIWNYDRDSRPRLEAALRRHQPLHVVELTSRRGMQQFLDAVTSGEPPTGVRRRHWLEALKRAQLYGFHPRSRGARCRRRRRRSSRATRRLPGTSSTRPWLTGGR